MTSAASATVFLGLLLQQGLYCMYEMQWIDFSKFSGTQLLFEFLYILSLSLIAITEAAKVISLEPIQSKKRELPTNVYIPKIKEHGEL